MVVAEARPEVEYECCVVSTVVFDAMALVRLDVEVESAVTVKADLTTESSCET